MSILTRIVTQFEQLLTTVIEQLPNVGIGLVLVAATWYLARSIRRAVERTIGQAFSIQAGTAFGRIAQHLTVIVGTFVALVTIFPSLDMSNLIEVLGIGGVAIGFAFRDILQNFFAGLLLLTTEPFKIGDQIIYDGYEGTVKQIETRATVIHTYDGRDVVVPNAELFTDAVTVNTAHDKRRYEAVVGIAYGSDIDRAREVALQTVQSIDNVLSDPAPSVLVTELADSSINLRVRWWAKSAQKEGVLTRDEMLTRIVARFEDSGIGIPFPTRELVFNTPLALNGMADQLRFEPN